MSLLLRILIAGLIGYVFGSIITFGYHNFWILPVIAISFLKPFIGIVGWLISEVF